ncbi:fungal chitosanase [Plectosphaerella cucumerina]|uniref:Endo-chitosanase n=1 Tax=Plectosphaerella cucumerina TaxID=40658 RepID=A0A8K0X002_9PEZI|nr:fungal chitosanase [Plectosphaerella cucumerina]
MRGSFDTLALLLALAATTALARDIPDNLQKLVDDIRTQGKCNDVLADGFHSSDGDSGDFAYCGDHLKESKIIYLQGQNGQFVNMDIDCDGVQGGPADDGRCQSSNDTQSQTTFQWDVEHYNAGQKDLDANVHPYVVFGNEGEKPNWPTFDPQKHGIEPLSIMAVVCNNQLVYGIWGDTNGDDGEEAMVGEAAISLATACFGNRMNGNFGHDDNDVLYIAFQGKDAVPGAKGAAWDASSAEAFQQSIAEQGDKLVERIGAGSAFAPSRWMLAVAGGVGMVLLFF